eukprot:CAMPEP_0204360606 /NCGR_PEP_ID=MMETSP0469-20131031/38168_1 /ASSEMBLY_ACC=CAM_ASM_000384 /TAXON_ID=2969 /ORGANISM="Oxyrrhis marina" /LENGTH=55 /DNA_ID=CAMNT_0051348855 /DNA_START=135 /DNA_END=302 /DNA_ORIENTATION=-
MKGNLGRTQKTQVSQALLVQIFPPVVVCRDLQVLKLGQTPNGGKHFQPLTYGDKE